MRLIDIMEDAAMAILGFGKMNKDDHMIRRDPMVRREPVNEYAPLPKRALSRAAEQHFSELERLEEQNETLRQVIERMHGDLRTIKAELVAKTLEIETVKRMASDEHKRAFHYEQYASTLAAHVGVIRTSLDAMSQEAVNMKPYESAQDERASVDQDQLASQMSEADRNDAIGQAHLESEVL